MPQDPWIPRYREIEFDHNNDCKTIFFALMCFIMIKLFFSTWIYHLETLGQPKARHHFPPKNFVETHKVLFY